MYRLSQVTQVKQDLQWEKKSADLTKTTKVIYRVQKGAGFYYEVLIQTVSTPNCCDKWKYKTKLVSWLIGVLSPVNH